MFLVLFLAVLINYNMMSNSEVDFLTNNVRVLQSPKNLKKLIKYFKIK